MQEYLAEFHKVKHRKKCGAWCQLMLLRLAIHIAVVAVIAGFGYLVWFIAPLTRSVSVSILQCVAEILCYGSRDVDVTVKQVTGVTHG